MTSHAGVYHQRKQPAAHVSVSGLPVERIMMAEDERARTARFVCNRSISNSEGRRGPPQGIEPTKLVERIEPNTHCIPVFFFLLHRLETA